MPDLFGDLPVPPLPAVCEQPAGHFWLRVGGVLIEGSKATRMVCVAGIFPAAVAPFVTTAMRAVSTCVEHAS